MKVMRSVHITNYYHEASGGVKSNYDSLLLEANKHRRYVSLIVPGAENKVEKVGSYGKIYYVSAKPAPFFDRRYRLMLPFHYLRNGSPIREILLAEKPEMIEIYDNYALTLLAGVIRKGYFKKLGRPMLVYFTGERFDTIFSSFVCGGKLGKWFSRRLMGNYNLAMFDFFIANSPFVAEELFESVIAEHNPRRSQKFFEFCWKFFNSSPRNFEKRVAICPRGVDTNLFSPSRKSQEFRRKILAGLSSNTKLLFSSTRISPEKNISLLPKIVECLPKEMDFKLLVAGAGPEKGWLEEEARRLSGRIVLLGHLDKETLANYYANVDVFIHPNPREPFGNVVLEAMASGCAVVVPNSGGVLTYASQDNAWLVKPTPEAFAKATQEALEDSPLRRKRIENAIKTAQENSKEKAIERLFQTYDRMYQEFLSNHSAVFNSSTDIIS
ncbi:MAG: glycosyltransferase [Acidobacteriota bacterium]|nr:glycosyltransferase [Acidobacteriota bacterium]